MDILEKIIGQDFSNFKLIGNGGFGSVYKAITRQTGNNVAIKVYF
jgi:serine/threonine protein kinase